MAVLSFIQEFTGIFEMQLTYQFYKHDIGKEASMSNEKIYKINKII